MIKFIPIEIGISIHRPNRLERGRIGGGDLFGSDGKIRSAKHSYIAVTPILCGKPRDDFTYVLNIPCPIMAVAPLRLACPAGVDNGVGISAPGIEIWVAGFGLSILPLHRLWDRWRTLHRLVVGVDA